METTITARTQNLYCLLICGICDYHLLDQGNDLFFYKEDAFSASPSLCDALENEK